MRRSLLSGVLAVLAAASQARAGDFTGAYAGVNAGYGLAHGRDAKKPGVVPNPGVSPPAVGNDLPPSAAVAAKSLQQGRPAASR